MSHVTPPHDEEGKDTEEEEEDMSTFPSAGITMPDVLECAMGVFAGIRADPGGGTYHTMKMPAMKNTTMTKNMIHMHPHPSERTGAIFS